MKVGCGWHSADTLNEETIMDTGYVPTILLWCALLNYGFLLVAFAGFVYAHDAMYRLHHRWFALTREKFDACIYLLLGGYKLAILFFLVVPYLVSCFYRYVPLL
jgi:hypothetical protein